MVDEDLPGVGALEGSLQPFGAGESVAVQEEHQVASVDVPQALLRLPVQEQERRAVRDEGPHRRGGRIRQDGDGILAQGLSEVAHEGGGTAQRVPVPTGSTTILVAVVKGQDVTVEKINEAMKNAASASFGYTEEPLVSSDVIGMRFGSLFDATQTMVAKVGEGLYQVQVVAWYDNENSYTSQMVRTIKYFAELQ